MDLKDIKLNDFIKIAVSVAITAALTLSLNIQYTVNTTNNYNQLVEDVKDIKQDVKTFKNDSTVKLNALGDNVTKSLDISTKILKEVD